MTILPHHAWILARLVGGLEVNGQRDRLTGRVRRMIDHLCELPPDERLTAWSAMLAALDDAAELINAVAGVDPLAPAPEPEATPRRRPANLGDFRDEREDAQWLWKGFIPAARISGVAAYEGCGKTRFALDLARRIWHAMDWPDGQPPTLPAKTPTLWVCADGQHYDLTETASAFGLPDEAIWFNTFVDEKYGGTELDTTEDRERLEAFIGEVRPGLVFIDTLTNATSFDLCRATETKALMTPLRDIAQRTGVAIVPLMHLSREGQALGRRIKGITRTLIHLECPDPERSGRLRLWVSKSFDRKPPVLGVTMGDAGNEYDHDPPGAARLGSGGRPPETRGKAVVFIRDALTAENDRIGNELARECESAGAGSVKTFWRAVDELYERGELARDGGKGTGKQVVLHLIQPSLGPDPSDPY